MYVIREEGSNYHKIGRSKDPVRRMGALQTGNPRRLELVELWEVPDPPETERLLHETYDHVRVRIPGQNPGEWFRLRNEDVEDLVQEMANLRT